MNSVFGKTMENVRGRGEICLYSSEKLYQKALNRSHARIDSIFEVNPWTRGICMRSKTVTLNKPIFLGLSVLDMSKVVMIDLHYSLKQEFGDRYSLLYTDTDSLYVNIECNNFIEAMQPFSDLFDGYDYPKEHPLHHNKNKKVIGKVKVENKGMYLTKFAACCPKVKAYESALYCEPFVFDPENNDAKFESPTKPIEFNPGESKDDPRLHATCFITGSNLL